MVITAQLRALRAFVSVHENVLVCDATGMTRNKQEFIINIYDPFMSIHDYSCSAAGRKGKRIRIIGIITATNKNKIIDSNKNYYSHSWQ